MNWESPNERADTADGEIMTRPLELDSEIIMLETELAHYKASVLTRTQGDTQMNVKSNAEKANEYCHKAAALLADANQARERGNLKKAELLYAKCQYWYDLMNKYRGAN